MAYRASLFVRGSYLKGKEAGEDTNQVKKEEKER